MPSLTIDGAHVAVPEGTTVLEAARAETAVISVGWNNYGHPTYEAIRRLEICGLEIYRTDEDGTVTVRTGYDGKES